VRGSDLAAPVLAKGSGSQLGVTTRFAVVGLVATSVYFGITASLGSRVVGMEPVAASPLGFLISVLVS
jgi:putative flippase GtrA